MLPQSRREAWPWCRWRRGRKVHQHSSGGHHPAQQSRLRHCCGVPAPSLALPIAERLVLRGSEGSFVENGLPPSRLCALSSGPVTSSTAAAARTTMLDRRWHDVSWAATRGQKAVRPSRADCMVAAYKWLATPSRLLLATALLPALTATQPDAMGWCG